MAIYEWLIALIISFASMTGAADEPTPTPTPVVSTPVAVTSTPAPDVQAIVCAPEYSWSCEDAMSIVWCESRNDPTAISETGDYGLFQINAYWHPSGATLDPVANTAYAYELWRTAGWEPWACQPE